MATAPAPTPPKAAIADVRTLDVRSVNAALGAARSRIAAIEAALNAPTAAGSINALRQQVNVLLQSLALLQQRVAQLENTTDPDVLVMVSSGSIEVNDPVVPTGTDTAESLIDGDPTKIFAVIGIAITSAGPGQQVRIRRRGAYQVPGVSDFEDGRAIYAGLNGMTQYPSYNDTVVPLGVAISNSAMWVAPNWPLLATPGIDPGFEDFLGVTYRVVADAISFMSNFNSLENGILVKDGANLVTTRVLREGANISITNADGVDGDPTIEYEPEGYVRPGVAVVHIVGLAPTVVVA
jgi:hypothetical protein